MTDLERGEDRHTRCRHGMLSQAHIVEPSGKQTPSMAHLCLWRPNPAPPALAKVWGGLTTLEDCAACDCFRDMGEADDH